MSLNPLAWLDGARAIDRLFQPEKKHSAILATQTSEIQGIKDWLIKLKEYVHVREDILVAEAKGAAAAVASRVASNHVGELSRAVGALEERTRTLDSPRLPPHSPGST